MDGISIFAAQHQCAPHRTHGSLEPTDSAPQTASWSVQPFLHTSWQKVPILYNGTPLSPSKLPLRMGGPGPHLMHASLGPRKSTTQTTSRFSHFAGLVIETDRQADHATLSGATGRIYVVMWCGLIITRNIQTFEMPKKGTSFLRYLGHRTWSRQCQGKPACQISKSKVSQFKVVVWTYTWSHTHKPKHRDVTAPTKIWIRQIRTLCFKSVGFGCNLSQDHIWLLGTHWINYLLMSLYTKQRIGRKALVQFGV